ncbi:hypothetical protein Hanom_Chr15g01386151 [Helianthus anomalus]
MPLCHSKVEQVTTEDLFELSEIEKHNLGMTRRTVSLFDVDNTPESLLVFNDNDVHVLYDFLLNYMFLLPFLNILDVPLLYSPVPFENATVFAPEVKCKEVRKIDHVSALTTNQPNHVSASISPMLNFEAYLLRTTKLINNVVDLCICTCIAEFALTDMARLVSFNNVIQSLGFFVSVHLQRCILNILGFCDQVRFRF